MAEKQKKRTTLEHKLLRGLVSEGMTPQEFDLPFDLPRTKMDIDFAWVREGHRGLIVRGVEVHGGQWMPVARGAKYSGGGHSHPTHLYRDAEKVNAAVLHPQDDVKYLVFYTDHIEKELLICLERVRAMLVRAGFPLIKDYHTAMEALFDE